MVVAFASRRSCTKIKTINFSSPAASSYPGILALVKACHLTIIELGNHIAVECRHRLDDRAGLSAQVITFMSVCLSLYPGIQYQDCLFFSINNTIEMSLQSR